MSAPFCMEALSTFPFRDAGISARLPLAWASSLFCSCLELEGLYQLKAGLQLGLSQRGRQGDSGLLFQHFVSMLACIPQGLSIGLL